MNGRTDLYVIRNGTLKSQLYTNGILRYMVLPYTALTGNAFSVVDNNYRPHRVHLVNNILSEEDIISVWTSLNVHRTGIPLRMFGMSLADVLNHNIHILVLLSSG